MMEGKMKRDIIVFVSPASAGKDYILNKCVEQFGWYKVVSHTTRTPRIGEHNGKDYWFVTPEEFHELERDGNFIETTSYDTTTGTWYYGFHKDSVESNGVKCLIVNPHGLDQFIEKGYADRMVVAYIVARADTRIKRYSARLGDSPTEHQLAEGFLRLLRDIEDFDKFDEQVTNERDFNWNYKFYYKHVPVHHLSNGEVDSPDYEIEEFMEFLKDEENENGV